MPFALNSDLFSGSSGTAEKPTNSSSRVLTVHKPWRYPENITIQRAGTPLYTIALSKDSKPNVQVSRMWPGGAQSTVIGSGDLHSLSCKADITLHGRPFVLKESYMSGSFSFICPPLPKMKWTPNLMGVSWELQDESGVKLAKYRSGLCFGNSGKDLEVMVSCDDFTLDTIVLSLMVGEALDKKNTETAAEVAEAVAGV